MAVLETINRAVLILLGVLGVMASYQVLYVFIGLLLPSKKFKETDKRFKYAILIAARNEELVIGKLVDSIYKQSYPQELIKVFVVAHNCNDGTASQARQAGAVVYEFNNEHKPREKRKGYALKFLLEQIRNDYATTETQNGILNFDGYFVLDADNLVPENYIHEYNKAFANQRYDYYNCYLSTKNYDLNYISSYSTVGLHSGNCNNQRPKSLMGISSHMCGRGILLRSFLLEDGWQWFGMTEDLEAAANLISRGYRGSYCEAAELFDEQPLTLKILMRQRMRWSRGGLYAFLISWQRLIRGIFVPYDWQKRKKHKAELCELRRHQKQELKACKGNEDETAAIKEKYAMAVHNLQSKRKIWLLSRKQTRAVLRKQQGFAYSMLEQFQKRMSCYDYFLWLFPRPLLNLLFGFLLPFALAIATVATGTGFNFWAIFSVPVIFYSATYLWDVCASLSTIIREHKRLRAKPWRLAVYILFWPFLTILLQYLNIYVLFAPVKWKPIPRSEGKEIEKVYERKTIAEFLSEKKAG